MVSKYGVVVAAQNSQKEKQKPKAATMTNDELTMNQKLWLCMTITDKCPYCNETIEIHPEDMGANLRSGNYMCRCPKCDKIIEIIISTSFQKREQQ